MITWGRFFCIHPTLRCVHGDEINARSGRITVRVACVDCEASFPELPLPEVCYYTGKPHFERTQP